MDHDSVGFRWRPVAESFDELGPTDTWDSGSLFVEATFLRGDSKEIPWYDHAKETQKRPSARLEGGCESKGLPCTRLKSTFSASTFTTMSASSSRSALAPSRLSESSCGGRSSAASGRASQRLLDVEPLEDLPWNESGVVQSLKVLTGVGEEQPRKHPVPVDHMRDSLGECEVSAKMRSENLEIRMQAMLWRVHHARAKTEMKRALSKSVPTTSE